METQEKSKHVNIILTDLHLHTNTVRNPKPWHRALMISMRNKIPGRFFGKITQDNSKIIEPNQSNFSFRLPTAEDLYQIPEYRGKIVHILMPKAGLPVYAGKDTVEFIEARKNRKWNKFKRFIGFDPSKRNNS